MHKTELGAVVANAADDAAGDFLFFVFALPSKVSCFIYTPPSYLLSFLPKFRGTYQFCLLFSAFHYTGLDKFGADVLIQ